MCSGSDKIQDCLYTKSRIFRTADPAQIRPPMVYTFYNL